MRIRDMTISDYDLVSKLWGITEGVTKRSVDSAPNIAKYLRRNPGMSLVAFDGEELIGAVLLGDDGRRGYIYHFTIKETHRRQGIGRKLEEEMCKRFSEKGIEKIFLSVFTKNERAIDFWTGTGWEHRPEIAMMSKLLVEDKNA